MEKIILEQGKNAKFVFLPLRQRTRYIFGWFGLELLIVGLLTAVWLFFAGNWLQEFKANAFVMLTLAGLAFLIAFYKKKLIARRGFYFWLSLYGFCISIFMAVMLSVYTAEGILFRLLWAALLLTVTSLYGLYRRKLLQTWPYYPVLILALVVAVMCESLSYLIGLYGFANYPLASLCINLIFVFFLIDYWSQIRRFPNQPVSEKSRRCNNALEAAKMLILFSGLLFAPEWSRLLLAVSIISLTNKPR